MDVCGLCGAAPLPNQECKHSPEDIIQLIISVQAGTFHSQTKDGEEKKDQKLKSGRRAREVFFQSFHKSLPSGRKNGVRVQERCNYSQHFFMEFSVL